MEGGDGAHPDGPSGPGDHVTWAHPPRSGEGRDGSGRPSRTAPRAVVVAQDAAIRDGWARALEATGMRVTRCVGPGVSCVLLRGPGRCPLLDAAGIALYHEAVLTEPFLARLRAAPHAAMAIATRDRHRMDGDHEPAMSRVIAQPSA